MFVFYPRERGERDRNLDPCQIDNFVSSLSSPPRIARISPAGLIWLNVDWLAPVSRPPAPARPAMPTNPHTEEDRTSHRWRT